jgi:predicted permease
MTLAMSLEDGRFGKTAAVEQLIRNGTAQLNAVPGVEMAAAGCCVPLQRNLALPFDIEGRPLPATGFHGVGSFSSVSPTYLRTFKVALIRGRDFDERDTQGAPDVVIINQAMARRFWPTGDPLTARVTIGRGLGPAIEQPARQIVGIAADVHDAALNIDPEPGMYVPQGQTPDSPGSELTWFVRTRDEPLALTGPIEDALRVASGGLPTAHPRTMEDVVGRSTARHDFNMSLPTIFAGAALLLAAIGIYGLMACSVEQRRQEIGIRLMLGADERAIRNMVLRQGMSVALAGVVLGIIAAFGLSQLVAGFLFGVTSRDPLVFAGTPLLLSAVAFLGVWLPARRAARIAPATALRTE